MDYREEILEILDRASHLRASLGMDKSFAAAITPEQLMYRLVKEFIDPLTGTGLVNASPDISPLNSPRAQYWASIVVMSVADYVRLHQLADGLPLGIVDFTMPK